MTDYVKGQNFTGLRGAAADPAVFDTEFSAVAAASATKMDKTGGTFTGPIFVPAANPTGETTKVLGARDVRHYAFPPGTRMLFFQATAPVGWTQITTQHDKFIRVVNTTGGTAGGVDPASKGITLPASTDPHALTINEMPAHSHTVTVPANILQGSGEFAQSTMTGHKTVNTSTVGGGQGHSHTIPATSWVPKYIDVIICKKD